MIIIIIIIIIIRRYNFFLNAELVVASDQRPKDNHALFFCTQ